MSSTPPRKRLLGGIELATSEKARERMELCQNCPHAGGGKHKKLICMKCGCPLHGKTKLHRASCPVGKW